MTAKSIPLPFQRASLENLVLLNRLRLLAIVLQCTLAIYAYFGLSSDLHYAAITLVIALQFSVVMLSHWLGSNNRQESQHWFLLNLYLDIILFSLFLYFSGGPTNPFVSYLLIPLTISAATLSQARTWAMAGIIIAIYALLIIFYQPLTEQSHATMHHANADTPDLFNLHVMGMWVNFVLSAIIISYFVVTMSRSLKQKDKAIQDQKDQMLVDEQVLAITSLAAGTAHELATPLNTLLLLGEELQHENIESDFLEQIQQQLTLCATTLNKLKAAAEFSTELAPAEVIASEYFANIIERWQLLRPNLKFSYSDQSQRNEVICVDSTIAQSILNLLNNCADAHQAQMELTLYSSDQAICFNLKDDGPGFSNTELQNIGRPFNSDKNKGFGIGLFLSHTAISRHNGSIKVLNNSDGGATVSVELPCKI